MKLSNAIKKLEKQGYKVDYRKYKYWDNVPFINDTAIVLDIYYNNSLNILTCTDNLKFEYILSCIKSKKENLGYLNENYKPFMLDDKRWNLHEVY